MRNLLILGSLPAARRRGALVGGDRYRVVSTSPWLSAQLQLAGIPHHVATSYGSAQTWDPIHAAAAQRVRRLRRRSGAAVDAGWFDDWSHLLVDEVREQTFWELVARGIVARERPRRVFVQRALAPSAAPAVRALAAALKLLGVSCRDW